MKQSAVAQAFKSITSRIHPQVALSEKESQRLINALNSSFNRHLDQAFPSTTQQHSKSSDVFNTHRTSAGPKDSFSSSADVHLASILTNPLFSAKPSDPAFSQLKSKSKHPISIFEDSVSRGQTTIDIARLCLVAFRASLKDLPHAERLSQLRETAAGTRVLRWLWSSGRIQAFSFAEDTKFLNLLTSFLYHEANDAAIWDLLQTPDHETAAVHRRRGYIMCSLIKAHVSTATDAAEATTTYLRASGAITAFLRAFDANQSSTTLPKIPLSRAGVQLDKYLKHAATESHYAPAALYDRFIDSCPLWDPKGPSDRVLYKVAGLKLRHPVSPSARDALYFIRHLKQSPSHPFLSPSTEAQSASVFEFFFDTVRLLQKQGYEEDAAWVMEFMQQSFPDRFGRQAEASPLTVLQQSIEATPSDRSEDAVSALTTWSIPNLG